MACTVFGTMITNETLWGMSMYNRRNITHVDKATVAFDMKNAQGKDVDAHRYLDEIRKNHNIDGIKVLIYNATGSTVRLVSYCLGDGSVGPSPIPVVIRNGQWGAYFHAVNAKPSGNNTGGHAIVYQGKAADGREHQWMFVMEADKWPGRCFNEIRSTGDYYTQGSQNYKTYSENLAKGLYTNIVQSSGCYSIASIGGDTKSPFFEGIMTLDGVLND